MPTGPRSNPPVETTMSWVDIVIGIGAIIAILSALLGGLVWLVNTMVRNQIKPVRDELKTGNGETLGQMVYSNRTLIQTYMNRFDEHLLRGHTPRPEPGKD